MPTVLALLNLWDEVPPPAFALKTVSQMLAALGGFKEREPVADKPDHDGRFEQLIGAMSQGARAPALKIMSAEEYLSRKAANGE